jgi:phosphoenolpyruvate phosphomutase
MQGLILAAGQGKRLGLNYPKALIEVAGQTLIYRLIRQFREKNINDIVIVAGYESAKLERALMGESIHIICNHNYANSDNLVSFWCGQRYLEGDFIITHSDLIFEGEVLQEVLSNSADIVLPYDNSSFDAESMKIALKKGKVIALDKNLSIDKSIGESLPLMKFSLRILDRLKTIIESFIAKKQFEALFETALTELMKNNEFSIAPINITGLKWCEIDTREDWEKANAIFG